MKQLMIAAFLLVAPILALSQTKDEGGEAKVRARSHESRGGMARRESHR